VPAGLVYQPKDMFDDPQFVAREAIATVHDERRGELRMQNIVPKLSETPGEIKWTGRPLGANTDEVLTEVLGLSAEQIEKLRVQGVIGHAPDAAKEGSR
jgi:formyl-CoA transferase